MSVRDVIIVGAGPSGLATAIALKQRDLDYVVLEKGALAESIRRFPTNMVFLTTPELMEIGGLPLTTPYDKPTRLEALRYYRKVADVFDLQISLREEVLSVEGEMEAGESFFILNTRSHLGVRRVRRARMVVLAMGYYDGPNLLNVPGEDLPHVKHYFDEPHPYYRQRVVIVGGKNSACEAALELYRNGAHVTLVHRGPALGDSVKYWVKPDIENRIRDGSIAARFNTRVIEIRPTEVVVSSGSGSEGAVWGWVRGDVAAAEGGEEWDAGNEEGVAEEEASVSPERQGVSPKRQEGSPKRSRSGSESIIPADSVLLLTGYRADPEFLRRAGVTINAETAEPRYDPQTFETNVPNLFIAGGQLAGKRTGTVFIENGRFHGERIAKVIAGRLSQAF